MTKDLTKKEKDINLQKWIDAGIINKNVLSPILNTLSQEYKEHVVYPQPENILRAFQYFGPDDITVVVVAGQPYIKGDIATGIPLANEFKHEKRTFLGKTVVTVDGYFDDFRQVTPALKVLKSSFETFEDLRDKEPFDWSLIPIVKQGALLLNSALTIVENEPFSHVDLWRDFIVSTLNNLLSRYEKKPYLFMGPTARKISQMVYNKDNKNKFFYAKLPSYYVRRKSKMPIDTWQEIYSYLLDTTDKRISLFEYKDGKDI